MISEKDGKICLSCEISNLAQIFRMKFSEKNEIHIIFPLKETVCFDIEKGVTSLEIENGDGELLAQIDITSRMDLWRGGATYDFISGHKYVAQSLAEKFLERWPENKLPFQLEELTSERFVLMTRYVGFPRNFYDALPFNKDTECIDDSFKHIDVKLRRVEDVCSILREYQLPSMKVLNRIFYTNPGLCYYAEELSVLWNLIKNPDLYVQFLKCKKVYELLAFLHDYPLAIAFFKDYKKMKSVAVLVRRLTEEWGDIRTYAVSYSVMSEKRKAEEQKKWKKDFIYSRVYMNYSRPIKSAETNITDCIIEGYSVVRLRTTNDFFTASNRLQNCLWNWENYLDSALFVIKKGLSYKAAIQIRDGKIVMVLGYANEELEYDEEAYHIYTKWKSRFALEEAISSFDPFDEGELPFGL